MDYCAPGTPTDPRRDHRSSEQACPRRLGGTQPRRELPAAANCRCLIERGHPERKSLHQFGKGDDDVMTTVETGAGTTGHIAQCCQLLDDLS
jgi:hypothetical protein